MSGLYVHFPFCMRKCRYCAFHSTEDLGLAPRFLAALEREIRLRANPGLPCGTVYFGGGTPSLMPPGSFARILDALRESFSVHPDAEISIEANPGSATPRALGEMREAGANRISIGIQSFSDEDLGFLGRIHDAREAERSVAQAREAGFGNVGVDLIYGLPGRGIGHWGTQLEKAARAGPDHVSCYALSLEHGTPLARLAESGSFRMPSEEEAREAFLFTHSRLSDLGYAFYEVSNFARSGEFWCRHNMDCWAGGRYLGFGPSAHSFDGTRRSWNDAGAGGYIAALEDGSYPPGGGEDLTTEQLVEERVMLGLRTAGGVDIGGIEAEFQPGFGETNSGTIAGLVAAGLASADGSRLVLTVEGLLVADAVAARFR